jgi:hypothetical protein
MAIDSQQEPWLRELDMRDALPAIAQPILCLMQVREDLEKWTTGLTDEQVWTPVHGLTPLGFHLKHLAGSTRRLTAYLQGKAVTDEMLVELRDEKTPGTPLADLLQRISQAFESAEHAMRLVCDEDGLRAVRFVGRKKIRTNVAALAIHIGEHAQRHLGEAIVLCQLLRA